MKKILLIVISLSLSIMILISGTYSWFFAKGQVENQFDIANLDVRLNEVFKPEWEEEVQKEVWATNVGSMPALVRLTAIPLLYVGDGNGNPKLDAEGNPTILSTGYVDAEGKWCSLIQFVPARDESKFTDWWMDGGDNWFYYREVLLPGEETALFLEKVKLDLPKDFFANGAHQEYIGAVLEVSVMMGSAPVIRLTDSGPEFYFEDVWDMQGNITLRDELRYICEEYFSP